MASMTLPSHGAPRTAYDGLRVAQHCKARLAHAGPLPVTTPLQKPCKLVLLGSRLAFDLTLELFQRQLTSPRSAVATSPAAD
jgi:hypothetical protein